VNEPLQRAQVRVALCPGGIASRCFSGYSAMLAILFRRLEAIIMLAVRRALLWAGILGVLTQSGAPAHAAERLGSYPVDPGKVSVSGISSGAFMANQLHIAHSADIMGAGIVAGGLYGCAVLGVSGDRVVSLATRAVLECMQMPDRLKSADVYRARIADFARRGWIDDPEGLRGDRVYVFTGGADSVVNPGTVEVGAAVYRNLGINGDDLVFADRTLDAGHSWVTDSFGKSCQANETPFINNCVYDQAEQILEHIYGPLHPPRLASEPLSGRFVEFSQAEFTPGERPRAVGMHEAGHLYVPASCASGRGPRCALHVTLHGCMQSVEEVGDVFYKNIGVNEWADTNDIVVLYPQANTVAVRDLPEPRADALLSTNPAGCWNWWGYAGDERYLLKDGRQVSAIYSMIQRILGRS
jgi:poly(3-hydroxybutyrate) depolymerase